MCDDRHRKVAAGGVATCFWPSGSACSAAAFHDDGYDALNRPVVKQYSDGTPTVKWCYDGKTYSNGACGGSEVNAEKGFLTAVGNHVSIEGATSMVSSTEYRHQALGLVRWSSQTVGGVTYAFEDPATHGDGYVYAQGRLTGMYYPSGRQLTFGYDAAGRPQSAIGTKDLSSTQYVTNISYEPQVEIDSLHYSRQVTTMAGGALVETALSNRRGQAFSIDAAHAGVSVWNLKNFYCGSEGVDCASNNGNVISQRLTAPKTGGGDLSPVTVYGYDSVNRLGSATESGEGTGWSQTFTYDRYGNQSITQTPLEVAPLSLHCSSYSAGNNRCAATTGFEYDNNAAGGGPGNITAFPGGVTASYDGENRQATLTDGGTWQYFYDGEGRRVKKVGDSRTVVYVYDAMGQLAAEYDSAPPEPAPCTTCYLTADHLGSTRLITDASGEGKRRYDYLPFGWDIQSGYGNRSTVAGYVVSGKTNPKFTGKERDYETTLGLDYFGARYFSAAQGRFTSPDPVYFQQEMLADPQRFNLYAYGRNNPLRFIDPSGEKIELAADKGERTRQLNALCSMAGQSSGCLKDVYDEDSGQYYVKSDENFAKLNDVAGDLQKLIDNSMTATVDLVGGDDRIGPKGMYTLNGGGPGAPQGADGLTVPFGGKIHVYVRKETDPTRYGYIPSDYMRPDNHPGYRDQNTVLGHELGHALYLMRHGGVIPRENPPRLKPMETSNDAALKLENKVRTLEDKNAAIRVKH